MTDVLDVVEAQRRPAAGVLQRLGGKRLVVPVDEAANVMNRQIYSKESSLIKIVKINFWNPYLSAWIHFFSLFFIISYYLFYYYLFHYYLFHKYIKKNIYEISFITI